LRWLGGKGANLQATNQLNLNTKNLEVSSVQNKHKAKTRSQGASELDLLLVVVLRLLALRLLVVRLSCPLSLPSFQAQIQIQHQTPQQRHHGGGVKTAGT
jgi:hypothetical protein